MPIDITSIIVSAAIQPLIGQLVNQLFANYDTNDPQQSLEEFLKLLTKEFTRSVEEVIQFALLKQDIKALKAKIIELTDNYSAYVRNGQQSHHLNLAESLAREMHSILIVSLQEILEYPIKINTDETTVEGAKVITKSANPPIFQLKIKAVNLIRVAAGIEALVFSSLDYLPDIHDKMMELEGLLQQILGQFDKLEEDERAHTRAVVYPPVKAHQYMRVTMPSSSPMVYRDQTPIGKRIKTLFLREINYLDATFEISNEKDSVNELITTLEKLIAKTGTPKENPSPSHALKCFGFIGESCSVKSPLRRKLLSIDIDEGIPILDENDLVILQESMLAGFKSVSHPPARLSPPQNIDDGEGAHLTQNALLSTDDIAILRGNFISGSNNLLSASIPYLSKPLNDEERQWLATHTVAELINAPSMSRERSLLEDILLGIATSVITQAVTGFIVSSLKQSHDPRAITIGEETGQLEASEADSSAIEAQQDLSNVIDQIIVEDQGLGNDVDKAAQSITEELIAELDRTSVGPSERGSSSLAEQDSSPHKNEADVIKDQIRAQVKDGIKKELEADLRKQLKNQRSQIKELSSKVRSDGRRYSKQEIIDRIWARDKRIDALRKVQTKISGLKYFGPAYELVNQFTENPTEPGQVIYETAKNTAAETAQNKFITGLGNAIAKISPTLGKNILRFGGAFLSAFSLWFDATDFGPEPPPGVNNFQNPTQTRPHEHESRKIESLVKGCSFVERQDNIIGGIGAEGSLISSYEVYDPRIFLWRKIPSADSSSSQYDMNDTHVDHHTQSTAENTPFDTGTWDPVMQRHPETGEPIFIYRVYSQGREVGSASFYKHPLLCRSETRDRHNIIATTGVLSEFTVDSHSLEEVCSALPPTVFDRVVTSAIQSAEHGAMRGFANVVGHTLQEARIPKSTANHFSQLIYYSGYFLLRYWEYASHLENDDWHNIFYAANKSIYDISSILLLNIIIGLLGKAANHLGQQAQQSGWSNTGKLFKFFGTASQYGIYAYNAAQNGLVETAASIASGAIVQTLIEQAGKLIISRVLAR